MSELRAFIGPSYADFPDSLIDLDVATSVERLLASRFGRRVFKFRPAPPSREKNIVRQWTYYWDLIARRPAAVVEAPATFGQLRARFDRALSARDEPAARATLGLLRDRFGISAENQCFLEIHLLAALERWQEIAGHRLLPTLIGMKLPLEIYGDIVEALYAVHISGAEASGLLDKVTDAFKFAFAETATPILRSRRASNRTAVLKTFVLYELNQEQPSKAICDELLRALRPGAFGAVDTAIRNRLAVLGQPDPREQGFAAFAAEAFDRAFALTWDLPDAEDVLKLLFRCAREMEDSAHSAAVMARWNAAPDPLKMAVRSGIPRTFEKVQAIACLDPKPSDGASVLRWHQETGETGESYVARWRAGAKDWNPVELIGAPSFGSASIETLSTLAIDHVEIFEQVVPLWIDLFVNRCPPDARLGGVYQELLEALRARDRFGEAELTLFRVTLERLLDAGPTIEAYRIALDSAFKLIVAIRSPREVGWSLDVCDLLAYVPCRDPEARLRILVYVLGMATEFQSRLSDPDMAIARSLAEEAGVELDITDSGTREPTTETADQSSNCTVALYSLNVDAARRARNVLLKMHPNLKVELTADEVATDKLRALARRADIFVFQWKSSTHPAFHCIKAAIPDQRRLIQAAGAGTNSMVRAAVSGLHAKFGEDRP
jgi:hypothetical protein